MYNAIFFDRDGTLTYFTKEKECWRDETIRKWSGKPFLLSYEKMMALFRQAAEGKTPWYNDLEEERRFFRRYYRYLLIGEGVTVDTEERAERLFSELWCNGDRALFPEVKKVLAYGKAHGYQMGVISDTSPSLEYTLRQLGIAGYFTSFTASSLVGAGKPDPAIYRAALQAQGVAAEESIYVDDTEEEADGARKLGFTSFYLDRSKQKTGRWIIDDLRNIIDFLENNG